MAARTVFVMLYVGALADEDRWIRPDQVTRMTDDQAKRTSENERHAWEEQSLKPKKESIPGRWYAANTREPIRDETIRDAFIPLGAVIETFAPQFLVDPRVIFLSESRNKVVARDDNLAQEIGFSIEPDRSLPDIILVDLGSPDLLIVFVEAVATDGPVNERRRRALLDYATDAGFGDHHVAFVTAYLDRDHAAFRKTVSVLAWRTFAWFVSEPDQVMVLWDGAEMEGHLSDLLGD